VIYAFEKVSGESVTYNVERREGDVVFAYGNKDKANTYLGWQIKTTLKEAIPWRWEQKLRS
jgi:UDP-glucose 4-epimerase